MTLKKAVDLLVTALYYSLGMLGLFCAFNALLMGAIEILIIPTDGLIPLSEYAASAIDYLFFAMLFLGLALAVGRTLNRRGCAAGGLSARVLSPLFKRGPVRVMSLFTAFAIVILICSLFVCTFVVPIDHTEQNYNRARTDMKRILREEISQDALSDPFSTDGSPFRFHLEGDVRYAASRGPDGIFDSEESSDLESLRKVRYDPTNGYRSAGDIIVFQGEASSSR